MTTPTITKTVYTAGYQGRTPDELQRIAERLDATVIDIRFAPFSRNPVWARDGLRNVLGNRYRHVHDLGNRNYRDTSLPIEILNLESGAQQIQNDRRQSVILLCVCKHFHTCHRKVVVDSLNIKSQELEWGDENHEPGSNWLLDA